MFLNIRIDGIRTVFKIGQWLPKTLLNGISLSKNQGSLGPCEEEVLCCLMRRRRRSLEFEEGYMEDVMNAIPWRKLDTYAIFPTLSVTRKGPMNRWPSLQ
ncbi:hypothetical protein DSO57_1035084 [Entomophthora muscae]|uniref:Uncharacterized protein n=1 Tax=Entomophthora muscae TaxID=34485 RepID=A0ACC2U997_9FUNG|nr:hypothetical protein DSO57_1035084 [Entomophthora muscae]